MIYDRIKTLCKEKHVSVNGLEADLGFAKGSLCKIDRNRPSSARIQKIADYFEVNPLWILGTSEDKYTGTYYIDDDVRDLANFLKNNAEYHVLFDASRKVKSEDIGKIVQMIDVMTGDYEG